MNTPSVLLGIVLSTLYGTAFHFWRGGSLSKLFLFLILSWIGFFIGNILATKFNVNFLNIGDLHFGTATLSSLLFLAAGSWLSIKESLQK